MRILFVCTGNTCRSPVAEALTRQIAEQRGLTHLVIESAGTNADEGRPASDGAVLVGLERQLDLTTHRARQLTPDVVEKADLILVMGPHHLERVEALGGAGKTYLLTDYSSRGADNRAVNDPFGGDLGVYRAVVEELDVEVRRAIDRLAAERATS
jgi:protein-tyrosine-phosphatase